MPPRSGLRTCCILAFAIALAACGKGGKTQGGPAGPGGQGGQGDRPTPVTAEQVHLRPWNDTVQALGNVKARESITVTAKVSEIVQGVHFDSGDHVAAGASLITLSGRAQLAALAQAEATAKEADQLLKRQTELAAQQLIARSSLDTQRATRDATRARVEQMKADIGDREVRAPFAGVLGIRQVSPGSLVTPGTPIATLDDTERVYIDFPVPETLLARIAKGQSVSGTSAAYPGKRFEGEVSTIDARIDPATRAVTVRGDFPNTDHLLRPGMLVQVTLLQPERQALLIPEISVVQVGTDSYVFRLKPDNTVERADVEVGTRREGLAEIVEGLKVGDKVVVDGTGKLRVGSKVDVSAAPAPAAQTREAETDAKAPAASAPASSGGAAAGKDGRNG
ncbi:efflux RND transporter periplasmic adaptor subunit [Lysobacter sp. TAB13]|uniref:efflux RND transporter periplasmic adaptor subunit n=1 Tax=Lysobacter sp. TAB13 TaxID=3233065 RepID=UPI003F9AC461